MQLRTIAAGALLAAALTPAGALADTDTTDLVLSAGDCSDGPFVLAYGPGAASGCNPGSFNNWLGTGEPVAWSAVDGLPLTLDAARKIHIEISVGNYTGTPGAGIGDETVTVTLTGKKQGSNATQTLGTGTLTTAAADRLQAATVVYKFDLLPAADKAGVYKELDLATSVQGSILSGYQDFDGASNISLPIIDGTEPVPPEDE